MPSVISLPDCDLPTRSASGFLLKYIAPRLGPIHLYSMSASRIPFIAASSFADIIIGVGHGTNDSFSGYDERLIMSVGNYQPNSIKGKVIRLISCQTALVLGPDLVDKGCKSYWGFLDDVVWVADSDFAKNPWDDPIAAKFLMPMVDGLNFLLDGNSISQSLSVERQSYQKMIDDDPDLLSRSLLKFNLVNDIILGDQKAVVSKRPEIPFLISPPPLITPLESVYES